MIIYPIDKKEKLSGIYVISNLINGKVYIGQSKNLAQRIVAHLSLARHIKKIVNQYTRLLQNMGIKILYFILL